MKHNDSSEKNKYGMLARRHDAINTNKFQSFANTIICIFGRKQFMVQLAWDDDEPHDIPGRRPAPLLYNCKQQNCVDWFIWSRVAYYIPSGWLLVIAAFYSCSQCSDHAPITPPALMLLVTTDLRWWEQTMRWLGLWAVFCLSSSSHTM